MFGAADGNDPLYESISSGRRYIGMEHWLPLFHERLETVFDYLPDAAVTFDHQIDAAAAARFELIAEHCEARQAMLPASRRHALADGAPPSKPVPPKSLFIDAAEWTDILKARPTAEFTPVGPPDRPSSVVDAGRALVQGFTAARRAT